MKKLLHNLIELEQILKNTNNSKIAKEIEYIINIAQQKTEVNPNTELLKTKVEQAKKAMEQAREAYINIVGLPTAQPYWPTPNHQANNLMNNWLKMRTEYEKAKKDYELALSGKQEEKQQEPLRFGLEHGGPIPPKK